VEAAVTAEEGEASRSAVTAVATNENMSMERTFFIMLDS
jgi:hypothetical protein